SDPITRQPAGALTRDDRRRRSHRQPDLRRAARRDVVGDLHTRATGADHQYPPRREALGVAVLDRVDQLPGEALAAIPIWNQRLILVAGRHYNLAGVDLALVGLDGPAAAAPQQPLDPCPEQQFEPGLSGMALDVFDHLVAGREHRRALTKRATGQV